MSRQKTGSIFTRKDRPGLWVKVPYRDESGRARYLQRRVESSVRGRPANKTDARNLIKQLTGEIERQGVRAIDGDRLTFAELAKIYEARKIIPPVYKGETKIGGMRSYRSARSLLKTLVTHLGRRIVKTITHDDLDAYRQRRLQTIIEANRRNQGGEMKVTSVNRELQLLRAMMNFARRQGWIAVNPFELGDSLISAAQETRRDRVMNAEEEKRLLDVCVGERAHLRALVIVAVDTGMRKGELLKICWPDMDFDQRLITIRATIAKTARQRRVGMTDRVVSELRKLRQAAPVGYDGLVFGIGEFKRAWASALRKAGIADLRFHDLRHTAATRMIAAGRPVPEVMRILGHTTMAAFSIYSNLSDDAAIKGAAALDRADDDLLRQLAERYPNLNLSALLVPQPSDDPEPARPDLVN